MRSMASELSGADAAAELGEMSEFLVRVVPRQDLAKLVQRLTRRTAGLAGMWEGFCRSRRLADFDASRLEASLLLDFLCQAVAHRPDRVAAVKGPFEPVMGVLVYTA